MSVGRQRVRAGFNPSGQYEVDNVKEHVAAAIDELEQLKGGPGEQARCAAIAQTKFEEAAMWATKAFTFREEEPVMPPVERTVPAPEKKPADVGPPQPPKA